MNRLGTPVQSEVGVDPPETNWGSRWWIYQRERFSLASYGPVIAAFSFAALVYSRYARGSGDLPGWRQIVISFGVSFLLFLQLRLADDFKDFEDDCRYRPYRPVPRGLVKRQELAFVWAACVGLQLLLALWLSWRLLPLLIFACGYSLMMTNKFLVRNWVRRHSSIYRTTGTVIMPLFFLYASACDWVAAGYTHPPSGLAWIVAATFFNGMVIEIGRKIRAPHDEEHGVQTYSFLFGCRNAVLAWLAAMTAAAFAACVAGRNIHFTRVAASLMLPVLLTAAAAGVVFLVRNKAARGKWIETMSGVWVLVMYLSLGAVPVVLRSFGGQK